MDYKATVQSWQDFLRSDVWHDLQLFIADRVEFNRDLLEHTDEERQAVAHNRGFGYESSDMLRGRNREANALLMAPVEILRELEEEHKDEH